MRLSSGCFSIALVIAAINTNRLPAQVVNGKPYAVSVTPSFGNGFDHIFQFVWADPDGFEDLAQLEVSFLPDYSGRRPGELNCTVGISTSSKALRLLNEKGAWSTPVGAGDKGTLENAVCSVDTAGASLSGSGKQVTVTLPIKFNKKKMPGLQFINMRAWDQTINLEAGDPKRVNGYDIAIPGSWMVGKKSQCQATFSRFQESVDGQGHAETVEINAPPKCTWAPNSGAKWISIESNKVGKGTGTVAYTIAPNPSPSPRKGAILVGPVYLAIQQAGSSN